MMVITLEKSVLGGYLNPEQTTDPLLGGYWLWWVRTACSSSSQEDQSGTGSNDFQNWTGFKEPGPESRSQFY